MSATAPAPIGPLASGDTQRLETLADGVFAIVMTLLVFEITPPKDRPAEDLARVLYNLWPSFLAYAVSVGLVGIYWSAHRSQFRIIRRTDHALNWLHLLFLAVVSLLPFSTRLLAGYHTEPLALGLYGLNLCAIGLSLLGVWVHATNGRKLIDPSLPESVVRYGYSRCAVGAFCYGLGAAAAFLSTPVALTIFATVPVLYILPSLQRFWLRLFGITTG